MKSVMQRPHPTSLSRDPNFTFRHGSMFRILRAISCGKNDDANNFRQKFKPFDSENSPYIWQAKTKPDASMVTVIFK